LLTEASASDIVVVVANAVVENATKLANKNRIRFIIKRVLN
jgi:hypothetical protein